MEQHGLGGAEVGGSDRIIMRNFITCTLHQILFGCSNKDVMEKACSMNGEQKYVQLYGEET